MSRLTDRLTSERFRVRHRGRVVTVYVENEEDVPFWKHCFDKFAPTLSIRINPSTRDDSARGKDCLLLLSEGPFLLLCIDSDYDYFLQDTTPKSERINQSPFIFQTYTYSIENYKCYAPSLNNCVLQACLNDNHQVDFPAFLEEYSKVIYPLFLYSFYAEKTHQHNNFTITDFCNTISLPQQFDIRHKAIKVLQDLENRVQDKINHLQRVFPHINLSTLEQDLGLLGLLPQNTYLFIQGHTLIDKVVYNMFQKMISKLVGEKTKQFHIEKIDDADFQRKQAEYEAKRVNLKTVLQTNTNYDDCFLMEKIKRDIEEYFNRQNPL